MHNSSRPNCSLPTSSATLLLNILTTYHGCPLNFLLLSNNIPIRTFIPFSLWQLWLTRNNNLFEHKCLPVDLNTVIISATKFYYLTNVASTKWQNIPVYVKWHPPEPEETHCNLNTDGAASQDGNAMGWEAFSGVRQVSSQWVLGFATKIAMANSIQIELCALLTGLKLAYTISTHTFTD